MIARRDFLKLTGLAGGGLILGIHPRRAVAKVTSKQAFAPNAWIRVAPDGIVTILVHKAEMGQGVATALPMLVNEELEADWSKIKVEFAPEGKDYRTPFGPTIAFQLTGGSSSVRETWPKLREAGAVAREMLIAAAAKQWNVKAADCRAEKSEVLGPGGKRLSYGELADAAARLPVPKNVALKQKTTILGTRMPRLDTPDKVTGKALFGIDVKLPGMLVAQVARCPVFGGKVKSFDASKAKAIPGVKQVVQISSGVAVIADGYWPAHKGVQALDIKWDEGKHANASSASLLEDYKKLAEKPGATVAPRGDAAGAMKGAAKVVEATFELPFLAHAGMEPLNATADVRKDRVDIWVGTQAQTWARQAGAKIAGVPLDKVTVHTTYLGGGFGRRSEPDFVIDAVECSKAARAPVKVIWSREDEIQHDYYRPAAWNQIAAGLDKSGNIVAWTHKIVCESIMARVFPAFVRNGLDMSAVEGAGDLSYGVPNVAVEYHMPESVVPVGFWRSVGHSHNAFVVEHFFDEVARAARKDPIALRRQLLKDKPRHLGVLDLAVAKAGKGKPGRHRGVAVAASFQSYCAHVVDITMQKGKPKVERVVSAIDCGKVVNPGIIEAQVQSGVVYALSATLYGRITIDQGRVQQRNFNDYPVVHMEDCPQIEVHIVPSNEEPTGVGEPPVPPLAPALANAILAATGKPVRKLPILG